MTSESDQKGLYDPSFEHDACGTGFIVNSKGKRSFQTISDALTILENMEHRGACGCDPNSGDGAGIMIQIPHEFFKTECFKYSIEITGEGEYAVGMVFFPKDAKLKQSCRLEISYAAERLGLNILGYRRVPVNIDGIGETALSVAPDMEQVFIAKPSHIKSKDDFERKLYVLRTYVSRIARENIEGIEDRFYFASLSSSIIVYKGQLTSYQVRTYFPDLSDKRLVSAFGMVHSRFSTNTFPSWKLAQPFRFISHNGEINTLTGNLNWFYAGLKSYASPFFSDEEMEMLLPIIADNQSDSACLDNMVELLHHTGRSLPHVMMMLVPEAWDGNDQMDPIKKAFYEFHATLMQPWDGPAAITFTDGKVVGALLDRNGLRPLRYLTTNDDRVIVASEAGVLKIDENTVLSKGRLHPGKIFLVDMEKGRLISDDEVKQELGSRQPYEEWLEKYKIKLEDLPEPRVYFTHLSTQSIHKYQQVFGYSREDIENIIKPMAIEGKEPIGSMGSDVPLAVLSDRPQHLSNYFKQFFAQVTNPPIDPIRERLVMSLAVFVGNGGNVLDEDKMHCHSVALKHPVLASNELEKLRSIDTGLFNAKTLQTYFKADGQPGSLEKGLQRLCRYAEDAVNDGFEVLILSDRAVDSEHAPIPSLLAVSAVHHHLIRKGLRGAVGIVAEVGDVWEVHHFACLIAFGATAINPYLALSTIRDLRNTNEIETSLDWPHLKKNYIKSICDGLLKIFSKMGISTLQSYHGAQIFEILGIDKKVVDDYFTGSITRIGGLDLDDIAREALCKHDHGFKDSQRQKLLPEGGIYQWKRRGEAHLFNPTTIHLLQHSTRTDDYSIFKKYTAAVNDQVDKMYTIRGLIDFNPVNTPISIDEVEPIESIMKRFATGAMSFGSISHEAHSTLAIAMNRIGGKSNTGEGGEDELRYEVMANGDSMRSSIKQIASARFGVTANYLTNADELQIKMAQGAKPGEGGQLPGHKVDEWIARVRHSTEGVGLISPPPHHDIYSIEDLAQLIFDLKNANRQARISVKLVSKAGVGTIAAGVAKAHADVILISGFDGGTGASPISSIKHAGLPWELGLAEAHQTLVRNKLRSRIVLQSDGQIKTGKDIIVAALLGAEEWGVATAALVVGGCIMMRKCHLNTCPVGVATQDPELRKLYSGKPEHIVNLFRFLAEEVREIMAELGFRTVNEMVGRSEFLKVRDNIEHWKAKKVDLSRILFTPENEKGQTLYNSEKQDHGLSDVLDWKLLEHAKAALESKEPVFASFNIQNTDRSTGTLLSNEITKIYKSAGLPSNTINYSFKGSAGQSFGAFTTKGISFKLEGEANDYVGKGLSGAEIAIYPAKDIQYQADKNIIIGNVAMYGATSGELFICGKAGERFAVRNSGATAIVEGVGDHGCEYMTGGKVLILGPTGRNFAAGMSGGIAWVYNSENNFHLSCNMEMIDIDPLDGEDENQIKNLLNKHVNLTNSAVAKALLTNWEYEKARFIKVFPKDYKRVLQQQYQTR